MDNNEILKVLVETLKNNTDLTGSVRELIVEIKHMRGDINKLSDKHDEDVKAFDNRLTQVENKPAKRYEQIVSLIITRHRNCGAGFFVS